MAVHTKKSHAFRASATFDCSTYAPLRGAPRNGCGREGGQGEKSPSLLYFKIGHTLCDFNGRFVYLLVMTSFQADWSKGSGIRLFKFAQKHRMMR